MPEKRADPARAPLRHVGPRRPALPPLPPARWWRSRPPRRRPTSWWAAMVSRLKVRARRAGFRQCRPARARCAPPPKRVGRQTPFDRAILAWAIAVSGDSNVPSTDIATGRPRTAGAGRAWPRCATIPNAPCIARTPAPRPCCAPFGDTQPQTVEGAIVLGTARIVRGRQILRPRPRGAVAHLAQRAAGSGRGSRDHPRIRPCQSRQPTTATALERMLYIDRISRLGRARWPALGGGRALTPGLGGRLTPRRAQRECPCSTARAPSRSVSPACTSPRRGICAAMARIFREAAQIIPAGTE